jgi:PP-loop superfamily ATP-utilizing enzyme
MFEEHHELIKAINELRETIMATQPGLTALTTAITDLAAAATSLGNSVQAIIAALPASVQEDASVAAAAAQIETDVAEFNTMAANVAAALTPPVPPTT